MPDDAASDQVRMRSDPSITIRLGICVVRVSDLQCTQIVEYTVSC